MILRGCSAALRASSTALLPFSGTPLPDRPALPTRSGIMHGRKHAASPRAEAVQPCERDLRPG